MGEMSVWGNGGVQMAQYQTLGIYIGNRIRFDSAGGKVINQFVCFYLYLYVSRSEHSED